MKLKRVAAAALSAVALAAGLSVSAPAAVAQSASYYILIGGTCDPDATIYRDEWLRGGIKKVVHYPAGAAGWPACGMPMDQSVATGHANARQVVQDSFRENPGAEFTIVGYSQGAVVANLVLDDIADGRLGVDRTRFRAKLFADPMQPVGPQSRGISAIVPAGAGLPSPYSGYISFGPGRFGWDGIPFIRYCIETDGICHAETPEAPGGYFAQHSCYHWPRGDGRSIMGDTIADRVFTNASQPLGRQNCRPPWPSP